MRSAMSLVGAGASNQMRLRLFVDRAPIGAIAGPSATIADAMRNLSRRDFLMSASAATLAAAATTGLRRIATRDASSLPPVRPTASRSFDWNPATGELADLSALPPDVCTVDWICFSPDRKYLFAACEVDSFNGKPTGEVASFRVVDGKLEQLSAQNSASKGTCHCAHRSHRSRSYLGRLRRRQRGQLQSHRRQAQPAGVERALHRARSQPRPAGGGARALRVLLARQSLRLRQRSGRRHDPHLHVRS